MYQGDSRAGPEAAHEDRGNGGNRSGTAMKRREAGASGGVVPLSDKR
jgi:hypothetical protein